MDATRPRRFGAGAGAQGSGVVFENSGREGRSQDPIPELSGAFRKRQGQGFSGYPVVDVAVALSSWFYHEVDSRSSFKIEVLGSKKPWSVLSAPGRS